MKLLSRLAPVLLLSLVATATTAAEAIRATILSGAVVETRGSIVEFHFKVRGRQPLWHVEGHHQQLALTLEHTELGLTAEPLEGQMRGPVTGLHATATDDGAVQLVLDVHGRVDYAVAFAQHDLIVRLARAGDAPDIAAPLVIHTWRVQQAPRRVPVALAAEPRQPERTATAPPPAPDLASITPPTVPPSDSTGSLRTPVVVIDPGHGGRDPGTQSASGIDEKDLALQIAIRLQGSLRARGITAYLTRSDDRFVSLAERTQMANREGADLFISIHLNSSPDPATNGLATYYLNNTTDRATIRLAQMENAVQGGYGSESISNLNYILTDLRQGDKAHESVAVSRAIESEGVAAASAASGARVNDLGVRRGPFYVLVGADMPAVLVECGFLSNADEAARLADARYEQGLADGIATAVASYFTGGTAVGNL